MIKYLKVAFSFLQTYVLLLAMIASPVILYYVMNSPLLIIIGSILLELVIFIIYLTKLVKVKDFKQRYNKDNYMRLLDYHYFNKAIKKQSKDIKTLLTKFYTEAHNILESVDVYGMKDMIAQSLLNVVNIGESYTSMKDKINKNMGTKYQQKEMINRNDEKFKLVESSYEELKELGGKLILMDDDNKNEKYVLDQLSMMNKVFETEIEK